MEKKYKVTVLLTKYCDPFSKFVKFMSRSKYTHASISVDPEENVFYSFNLKGFVEERWKDKKSKYLLQGKAYLHLYVTEEVYLKLKKEIERFGSRKKELSYSVFGTLLCLFKIPSSFRRRYFCSRFVAEVLNNSGAMKLKREHSLYLPSHFLKELGPATYSV